VRRPSCGAGAPRRLLSPRGSTVDRFARCGARPRPPARGPVVLVLAQPMESSQPPRRASCSAPAPPLSRDHLCVDGVEGLKRLGGPLSEVGDKGNNGQPAAWRTVRSPGYSLDRGRQCVSFANAALAAVRTVGFADGRCARPGEYVSPVIELGQDVLHQFGFAPTDELRVPSPDAQRHPVGRERGQSGW